MQRRVLIVEDEVMVAWALVDAVRQVGWRVCATVATEQAAVEAAAEHKPDAILMDYRLGHGGDGLLAARRIRAATDVPIIFCTAYADGLGKEILSVPHVQMLSKPVRPLSLRRALDAALAPAAAVEPEQTRPAQAPSP